MELSKLNPSGSSIGEDQASCWRCRRCSGPSGFVFDCRSCKEIEISASLFLFLDSVASVSEELTKIEVLAATDDVDEFSDDCGKVYDESEAEDDDDDVVSFGVPLVAVINGKVSPPDQVGSHRWIVW